MTKLLLLYDTKETDLARDFQDLLSEVIEKPTMIPLSPDYGHSLKHKEDNYFNTHNGALFLITKGAQRDGKWYPSPSLADEMGRAREKYPDEKKRFYLVEKDCHIQAIDPKCYIPFDRNDVRKIIQALILLFRNLKASGFLDNKQQQKINQNIERQNPEQIYKNLDKDIKNVIVEISHQTDGAMTGDYISSFLQTKHGKKTQDINIIINDIKRSPLINYDPQFNSSFFRLTPLGWEVIKIYKKDQPQGLVELIEKVKRK